LIKDKWKSFTLNHLKQNQFPDVLPPLEREGTKFSRFVLKFPERLAVASLIFLALGGPQLHAEESETPEPEGAVVQPEGKVSIRRFEIVGNRRFSLEDLNPQLMRFVGRSRSRGDLETARDTLETFYHDQGYADAVVTLIDPQPVKGVVRVQIVETKPTIKEVTEESKLPNAGAGAVVSPLNAPSATPETVLAKGMETAPIIDPAEKKAAKEGSDEFLLEEPAVEKAQQEGTFTIKGFVIEGTYLFPQEALQKQIKNFVGRGKTAADVEGARDALERYFHEQGYPAMLVNIPAQSSSNRVFRLEVIENRIGNVLVSGNRWYSTEKILRDLPSITPGRPLQLKELQAEINAANRNPDFKAIPEMLPGKAPGSIDLALKIEEQLPLHGSLELNNRFNHDTTALRLNAALRYDNLWQRDHSISLQYQTSPQDPNEVEVFSSSYTMPTPWNREDKLVAYGVVSNSNTNSAAGFSNLGKGTVVGSRLIMPLQGSESFFHTAVLGFDYKDFSETVGVAGGPGSKTPITYFPVNSAYSAYLRDSGGLTSFTAGLSMIFRGAVSDAGQFADKRYKSTANALVLTAGLERNQQLPGGFALMAKLDGQLSDQPLISNEQYSAGGVESVRGYHDSEASGDNAIHGVLELASPELLKQTCQERCAVTPYIFYDAAHLGTREPLPSQDWSATLQGIGFGLRGTFLKGFDFQTDVGFPLRENSRTRVGEPRLHFKVRYQF
jgi:hemolysin activation/secretion protein